MVGIDPNKPGVVSCLAQPLPRKGYRILLKVGGEVILTEDYPKASQRTAITISHAFMAGGAAVARHLAKAEDTTT
ncbi:MAG: hypothetical protein FD152_3187 [Xanthobacteraceae bacterium]|nr:MAG: hypothetical protein FD152_3187 [Xanthobacteraceae bacterium]